MPSKKPGAAKSAPGAKGKSAEGKVFQPNPQQERFIQEYLIDLNATQAALRAGYSPKTAYSQGDRLLKHVEISKLIAAAQAKRAKNAEVDADYVLRRMVEIDQMDVLDIMTDDMVLKPVSQWPRVWRQYLSGFDVSELFEGAGDDREMVGLLKKIKWPDKVRNLELLGKHLGMFKDRVEVTGKNGKAIEHSHAVKVVIVPQKGKAEVSTRPLEKAGDQ